MLATLLVVFSLQQARKQDREAKERGAFLRGLQNRAVGFMKDEELGTPLPTLQAVNTRQHAW